MKNLITRTLTGLIYIVLIIGGILYSKYTFAAIFTIFLSYTLYEFYRLSKHSGYKPNVFLGILTGIYFFISSFLFDTKIVSEYIFLGLIPLLMLIPIIELFKIGERSVHNIAITIMGLIYVALPFSVLTYISTPFNASPDIYSPKLLLGLFILLWANDSGAYLIGSWLGKHKLIERVSPKKTWEGAIGGAIVATLAGIVLYRFTDSLTLSNAIIISLLTVVAGTFGDLFESLAKRNFMVKDSGHILPGHGGMLDRFDSMLFAAPIYYAYVSLIIK